MRRAAAGVFQGAAAVIARGLVVVFLLLGVAGCATPPGGDSCAFVREGEIDVRYVGGEPIADVTIDGHVVPMIVDTGASLSALTETTAKALHLRYQYNATSTTIGGGGVTTITHPVVVETLAVGGVTVRPGLIPVVPAGSGGVTNPVYREAGGLLGLDVLAHYDLDVDLPHQRIVLMRQRFCPQGGPPWPGKSVSPAPAQTRTSFANMPFWVRLDGHPIIAVFDTGDTHSTVSFEAANLAGVDAAALQSDRVVAVAVANANAVATPIHRFRELEIGSARIAAPMLLVQRLVIDGPTMLIGEAIFRHNRVYLSYASHRAFITP
jgi:predicted aspartyl protease